MAITTPKYKKSLGNRDFDSYIADSSGEAARKCALLGKDGANLASTANPVPVDAIVTVDSMTLNAEMTEATGHDYYTTTTNLGTGVLTVGFDSVAGLDLGAVIKFENKTQGWVYNTKGATVGATSILLVAANQEPGYPVPGITDEFEIVYRGKSRLTDKTQMSQITDGTNEAIVKAGNTFAVADVALGVADANVLTALSAVAIPTTIVGGTKDVTTAGTREALGASTTIKSVTIRAKAANGGNIYVGGVTVDSANGIALAANDSVELDIANLATVYVDSSIDGEGVGFTYFN